MIFFPSRRELEKLVKEIRSIDPDKKCQFKYDKLLIDDDVFVFNDVEKRIERLPYTVAGRASGLEEYGGGGGVAVVGTGIAGNSSLPLLNEDTPSATLGRHRYF